MSFTLRPRYEVLNDKPRVAIIKVLWWNIYYRSPRR